MFGEPTVKSIVLDLYDLTQATSIRDKETQQEVSIQVLQDIFYQDVEQLADLLGIDLAGPREV